MLKELRIRQLGLVEDLVLTPGRGLCMLTGETGAGKSMIAGAFSLLLGGRGDRELVREGSERAVVEGLFDLGGKPMIRTRLDEYGVEIPQDDMLLLRREISREGRGRVLINGRLSSQAVLESIGPALLSVQSQNQQSELLSTEFPLHYLDELLDCRNLREELSGVWARRRAAIADLEDARQNAAAAVQQLDIWRYQFAELEAAGLDPAEEPRLRESLAIARNSEVIRRETAAAYEALAGGEHDSSSALGRALTSLRRISGMSVHLGEIESRLMDVESSLSEAAMELERFLDAQQGDPESLQEMEERLALYEDLQRKYRQDVKGLCVYRDLLSDRLQQLEESGAGLATLQAGVDALTGRLQEVASRLHVKRSEGSESVSRLAESVIRPLALPDLELHFVVKLLTPDAHPVTVDERPVGVNRDGADRVEIQVRTNRGESTGPINQIASGGELSRIYLGLVSLLRQEAEPPLMLLDEADSGLGNDAALPVGQLLRRLAADGQVICITHLPTMAAHGQHHWKVAKATDDERTVLALHELDARERVQELARMLGGTKAAPTDPKTQLKYAEDLLVTLGQARKKENPG